MLSFYLVSSTSQKTNFCETLTYVYEKKLYIYIYKYIHCILFEICISLIKYIFPRCIYEVTKSHKPTFLTKCVQSAKGITEHITP